MKIISTFCLLLLIVTGCSSIPALAPPTPTLTCREAAVIFLEAIDDLATEWDDANSLAGNTPRIALGPVVSNMQELRRRADRLSPPDCAYFAKDYLVQYMDYTIEGYLNFMADEPANYKFDEADRLFEKYVEEMKSINSK